MSNKKRQANCETCEECIYIGDGDYVCGVDYTKMVMSDCIPTVDFGYCNGEHYTEW